MFTLFHHPFCPHSRFIRLIAGEYGLDLKLVEERSWERREAFLLVNAAGTTPVMVDDEQPPVPGAAIIAASDTAAMLTLSAFNSVIPLALTAAFSPLIIIEAVS